MAVGECWVPLVRGVQEVLERGTGEGGGDWSLGNHGTEGRWDGVRGPGARWPLGWARPLGSDS